MKRTMILWVTAALALAPAYAQDASSDFGTDATTEASADSTPAASFGTFKWSGDQEFAWRQGVDVNDEHTGANVDSKLSGEYKYGDLKVVAAGQVRNGEYVPGETAVFYAPGPFKFGVGLQEFSWGLADKKNPTDTLNARDYRYGADAPRLVNPAATATWYPADWLSIDAVYEPWKVETKFPKDFVSSTQAGLDASEARLNAAGLSGALTAAGYDPTASADTLAQDFGTPIYGARANFFLPGVDLSASYVYDIDAYFTPEVTLDKVAIAANTYIYVPGEVKLVHKRIHRAGLNAKTTIEQFGLWVESAYNITEDPSGTDEAIRNSKLSWTTGFDFNYGPGSVYYMNFQYAGEWIPGYDASTTADYTAALTTAQLMDRSYMLKRTYRSLVQSLGSETEELMNTFTTNLKWPLADDTVIPALTAAVIVPVGYDETLAHRYASLSLKPEVDLKPVDGIHILFGSELYYAWVKKAGSDEVTLDTSTDKLGLYTPQNNVYVKVQYKWNGSFGD